jgi:acetyl-CoA acetyltransferase
MPMTTGIFVLGVAIHEPAVRHDAYRLEELVYRTSRAALDDAGVARSDLDAVTLGASDEIDGRPISSMLLAPPAGAFLTDEIRVTDSAASAVCLAVARMLAGDSHLNLVAGWCKSSKADFAEISNARAEPFYTRPLGFDATLADALFAQVVAEQMDVGPEEVAARVVAAYGRAASNPRGMAHPVPSVDAVAGSPYSAVPLRTLQSAPMTDGAACLILASETFLRRHPSLSPLARITGVGWATDSYRLDRARLADLSSARAAWDAALGRAGVGSAGDFDVVEMEAPTGYHEAALTRAFGVDPESLSPSGGAFAQNPHFCSGLVNAAEAVLQVSGRAGEVQRPGAKRAAAHSSHGFAQQGNVVIAFEGDDGNA